MDIDATIAALKAEPGFAEKVGMILVHNGVVRGTRRGTGEPVARVDVRPDHARIAELCAEYSARPGIFRALAEARGGVLEPGDDLLWIVVAGDIRENVKAALAELLDRIKSEAVAKREELAGAD
ncbi:MAG: molybdenum cofactor biosynthesis protein MoaE [Desulfovibrionaceae bacterium]|jgi:molybdopterin synthase catalytic subunit|nr:molybdenum cofactor biosynthesis protein MoaE [Desulfovibrionaceae bacterium]